MTDFDDDDPTWVTEVGAIPEAADPDEDETTTVTVARCAECLRPVHKAGPIPPTSPKGAAHASPETCLRGTTWSWCAQRGRLSLWLAR